MWHTDLVKWEYGYVTSASHPNYGTATSLVWRVAGGQTQTIFNTRSTSDQGQAIADGVTVLNGRFDLFARLGQDGWEMVGFQGSTFYFKRGF